MPRTQISDDGTTRVYRVTDAQARVIGTDAEPSGASKTASDNASAMQAAAIGAIAQLESADANWATLTAGQKDAATRLAVRVAAKLTRLALGQLDSA